MVNQCFVSHCRTRALKNCGVSFHKLPLDNEQREKWLKAIRPEEDIKNINQRNILVCSKHFTSNDFRQAGSSIRIKKNVIPSIFPWCGDAWRDNNTRISSAEMKVRGSNRLSRDPLDLEGNVTDDGKMYHRAMPGTRCAVAVCNNNRSNAYKSVKVSFYRFPKNKQIRKVWIQRCQRAGKWNPDTNRVCSEHFTDDDYQRNLQAELLNIPTRKKLKETAIPSLKLSKTYIETASPGQLERRRRFARRTSKSLVNDILAKENEIHEDSAVIVKTENVWLPSISQTESPHMTEETKYETSSDVVKTETEVWLPSISQSESSQKMEENEYENNTDIVKIETEVWSPSISQTDFSHMTEQNKYESIADIVKTETEVWSPSDAQTESSHMIEENRYEGSAIVNEAVVWMPAISDSAPLTTENVVWLPSISQSESSQTMVEKYENLLKKYETVVKENEEIRRQMRLSYGVMEENKQQLKILQKELADLTSKFSNETAYRIQLENSIKHVFSIAQQDMVLLRRKNVLWSAEDMSNALSIKNISKKCYIYLRNELNYPLPDIPSLQRWENKLKEQQTVLPDVSKES